MRVAGAPSDPERLERAKACLDLYTAAGTQLLTYATTRYERNAYEVEAREAVAVTREPR